MKFLFVALIFMCASYSAFSQTDNQNKTEIIDNSIVIPFPDDELSRQQIDTLDKIVNYLKEDPEVQILITGHYDNSGKFRECQEKSLDKAKTIFEYFLKNGISEERMNFRGRGSLQPIYPNDSEKNKRKNRRVEIGFSNRESENSDR